MDATPGQKPYNLRLPKIGDSVADVQKIFFKAITADREVTDEQLEMMSLGSDARYGEYLIHAQDPEWAAAIDRWYTDMFRLVSGLGPEAGTEHITMFIRSHKDKPADYKRWALMMLWLSCIHLKSEYIRVTVIDALPPGTGITHEKIFMLDRPDSDIWNDDERLVLKYIDAVFNFRMSDELFQAAVEAWGPKTMTRSIGLMMYYYMMTLLMEATGHDRWVGLDGTKPFSTQTGWPEQTLDGQDG